MSAKADTAPSILPRHVAIVMDGNGRWAKRMFMNRAAGHRAGAQALRNLSEQMNRAGYAMLTVYAFSTENWKRSDEEVAALMGLLREYIQSYINDSKKNNIRICTIGDLSRLDDDLRKKIAYLGELTKNHDGLRLNIAINYGGRDELLRAVKRVCRDAADEKLNPELLTEDAFTGYLDTAALPDPDLWIRTGGDMRLSNFLLWQSAYAELVFSDKLWPDYTIKDLSAAVESFHSRERRFGGRKE